MHAFLSMESIEVNGRSCVGPMRVATLPPSSLLRPIARLCNAGPNGFRRGEDRLHRALLCPLGASIAFSHTPRSSFADLSASPRQIARSAARTANLADSLFSAASSVGKRAAFNSAIAGRRRIERLDVARLLKRKYVDDGLAVDFGSPAAFAHSAESR